MEINKYNDDDWKIYASFEHCEICFRKKHFESMKQIIKCAECKCIVDILFKCLNCGRRECEKCRNICMEEIEEYSEEEEEYTKEVKLFE